MKEKIGTIRYGTLYFKKSKLSSLFYKLFYVNLCRFFFPGAGSRSYEPEPVKIRPAPQHWPAEIVVMSIGLGIIKKVLCLLVLTYLYM